MGHPFIKGPTALDDYWAVEAEHGDGWGFNYLLWMRFRTQGEELPTTICGYGIDENVIKVSLDGEERVNQGSGDRSINVRFWTTSDQLPL